MGELKIPVGDTPTLSLVYEAWAGFIADDWDINLMFYKDKNNPAIATIALLESTETVLTFEIDSEAVEVLVPGDYYVKIIATNDANKQHTFVLEDDKVKIYR